WSGGGAGLCRPPAAGRRTRRHGPGRGRRGGPRRNVRSRRGRASPAKGDGGGVGVHDLGAVLRGGAQRGEGALDDLALDLAVERAARAALAHLDAELVGGSPDIETSAKPVVQERDAVDGRPRVSAFEADR